MSPSEPAVFHGTTIVSVRRGRLVALGGDGQVTLGNTIVKSSARKVRKLYRDQVLAGFAGERAQPGPGVLDLLQDHVERGGRHFGIVAELGQRLALAIEFLKEVGFQIGARGNVEDIEQRGQRHMVVDRCVAS